MSQCNKIFYVHMISWDFIMELGQSPRQWLKANQISFEQKGNNFFVLDADGQRTGEVYSLVSELPTDATQKAGKQIINPSIYNLI